MAITELVLNHHQHKMTVCLVQPQKDQIWDLTALTIAFKSRFFGSAKLWQEELPGVQHIILLCKMAVFSKLILHIVLSFHLVTAFNLFDSNLHFRVLFQSCSQVTKNSIFWLYLCLKCSYFNFYGLRNHLFLLSSILGFIFLFSLSI